MSASTGVKDDGFSSLIQRLLPSMPLRLRSHAVTVVPTFAPIITFIACRSVISPELTNPTTMTVVADELCIIAVTPSPVRKPIITLLVILSSSVRSRLPARRSSACPMRFMPNRKSDSPPIIVSALKISMSPYLTACLHFYPSYIIARQCQIRRRGFVKSA